MQGYTNLIESVLNTEEKQVELWVCDFKLKTDMNTILRNLKPKLVKLIINKDYLEYLDHLEMYEGTTFQSFNDERFKLYQIINGEVDYNEKVDFYGKNKTFGDKGVHYFYDEYLCIEKYNELVYKCISKSEEEKEKVVSKLENKINLLKNMFYKSDYTIESLINKGN